MYKHTKLICVAIVLLFTFLFVVGCSQKDSDTTTQDDIQQNINELNLEKIYVDIATKDNGFYSMIANASLLSDENGIYDIYITNPTLMTFKVSDSYIGGVCLIDGADIETILNRLNGISEDIASNDDSSALEKLKEIVNFLNDQAILDYCPT